MKTKFTKGEWESGENSSYFEVKRKGNPVGTICAVFDCVQKGYEISAEEQEANAKLIAASPIMYNYIVKKAEEGDEDAKLIVATLQ